MRIATGRRRRGGTEEDARWVERVDANVAVDAFDPPWWRRRIDQTRWTRRFVDREDSTSRLKCLFRRRSSAAIVALHSRSLPLATDVNLAVVARDARVLGRGSRGSVPRGGDGVHPTSRRERNRRRRRCVVDGDAGDGARFRGRGESRGRVRGSRRGDGASPTTWDDIGGLEDVKRRLRQAVEWPLRHAEAFARLEPVAASRDLLHGPPGCAKTTMARAAATASGATTVTLAAADVFSKYVGEGERVLRDAFARARRAAPAVLLLDEIDGMVGSRGAGQGDASDVGARILSVLLTEMDGLEPAGNDVLVVATTNRPEALDAALTRPGRLDLALYVPPPDLEGRLAALRVHARDVPLAADADLEDVARRTERFTGRVARSGARSRDGGAQGRHERRGGWEETPRIGARRGESKSHRRGSRAMGVVPSDMRRRTSAMNAEETSSRDRCDA